MRSRKNINFNVIFNNIKYIIFKYDIFIYMHQYATLNILWFKTYLNILNFFPSKYIKNYFKMNNQGMFSTIFIYLIIFFMKFLFTCTNVTINIHICLLFLFLMRSRKYLIFLIKLNIYIMFI